MSRHPQIATLVGFALLTCGIHAAEPAAPLAPSLKDAVGNRFHIGAALGTDLIKGEDPSGERLLATHFNSITPGNIMKWEHIEPKLGQFDFDLADRFVALGQRERMQLIGHTLMWHSQTPDWVFQNADGAEISREELLQRLRHHIAAVVGRYKGKVAGWDVVNEAIQDKDGLLRTDKPWYRILGEEGIFAAFEAAHQADPDAELYYNDYSLENPVKRAGVLKLVQAIRARGLRIDAVGSQGHWGLDWPTIGAIEDSLNDFAKAGFKVMITELDVTVLPRPMNYFGAEISTLFETAPELDPYRAGMPADKQAELARRYAEIFAVFAKHSPNLTRVTFWGTTDRTSWLNNFPIRGRTDYPLLWDRAGQPKPALPAVIEVLKQSSAP